MVCNREERTSSKVRSEAPTEGRQRHAETIVNRECARWRLLFVCVLSCTAGTPRAVRWCESVCVWGLYRCSLSSLVCMISRGVDTQYIFYRYNFTVAVY